MRKEIALRATRPSLEPEADGAVRLATGDLLGDRYCVDVAIGRGGWADVYRATDRVLGRRVAIKVLREQSESARHRFVREARLAAAVTHPNVATVFDVGRTDRDDPFLVMELLEGASLGEAWAREHARPATIVSIARQILGALSALEALGIVHRDLKPDNVFLHGARREVKLVDFGIATAGSEANVAPIEPLTEAGSIIGTPQYMAPEQIDERGADHRSDLYALGVIMYEMACGRRPHEAVTPGALFAAILRDPVPPIEAFRAEFPSALAAVIHRALEPEPGQRFQSAGEMAEALAAVDLDRQEPVCEAERPPRDAAPTRRESVLGRRRKTQRRWRAGSGRSVVRTMTSYLFGLGFALALLAVVPVRRDEDRVASSASSSVQVHRVARAAEAFPADLARSRPQRAPVPVPRANRVTTMGLRESTVER